MLRRPKAKRSSEKAATASTRNQHRVKAQARTAEPGKAAALTTPRHAARKTATPAGTSGRFQWTYRKTEPANSPTATANVAFASAIHKRESVSAAPIATNSLDVP